jgi:hypothetical protein
MKPMTGLIVMGTGLLLVAVGCAQHMMPGTTTTTLPSSIGAPVVITSPGPSANPSVAGGSSITSLSDGSKVQVILPPLVVATTKKVGPAR